MKTTITLLAALLLCTTLAVADPYRGTIEYSFTSLVGAADPGQSFTGWYAYDSADGDGVFNAHSITGSLSVPLWMCAAGFLDLGEQFNLDLRVVAGVPDFAWGCDWGALSMNFYDDHFNFGIFRPETGSVRGTGVVTFGGPSLQVAQLARGVPDGGSTAALLLGALLGIACLRVRLVRP